MIGLTSTGNVEFVRSLGCYDEVVTYERVTSLPPDTPVAYVDMAGNSGLRETLHRHFGEQIKYSGRIGLTHRASSPDEPALPGARPSWFFAPDQDSQAREGVGPGGIDDAFRRSVGRLCAEAGALAAVTESRGPEAVKRVYLDTLNGRVPPQLGHILSLAG